MPNLWEFPGGKVEKDESIDNAIVREIKEELDCDVEFINVFYNYTYEYDNTIVNLITVTCRITACKPTVKEHAKLIWVNKENLDSLKWVPADIPTVELLISQR